MSFVKEISELFQATPPDFIKIRERFRTGQFTKEELSDIAYECIGDCWGEYRDACETEQSDSPALDLRSNYILEMISLLLEFGLDPNLIVNYENPIWSARFIDAPNIGASVLRLLLENGGDPNHFSPSDNITIFDHIYGNVCFDELDFDYDHTVQYWLVLMAFGGRDSNGNLPLVMLNGNSVEIFKNFELYDFWLEAPLQGSNQKTHWIMHIYHVDTKEEVARL